MKLHDLQVGQRFTFTDKHRGKVFEIVETGRQIIAFRDIATNEVRITASNRKTFRMEVDLEADRFVAFNLNEKIKVRLNDKGYQHMADLNNSLAMEFPGVFELRTADYYKQQADKGGYTEFQVWQFIQDFGPTLSFCGRQLFDITVLIELPKRRKGLTEGE